MRIREILEERFFRLEVPTGICMVHEDPTARNLLLLLEHSQWRIMRGLISGEHLYWWDAERANHDQIAPYVGIDDLDVREIDAGVKRDPRSITLSRERDGRAFLSVPPEMRSHPGIERLCRNDQVVIESANHGPDLHGN